MEAKEFQNKIINNNNNKYTVAKNEKKNNKNGEIKLRKSLQMTNKTTKDGKQERNDKKKIKGPVQEDFSK